MNFEKMPIPVKDVDYREVARVMRVNIDILKQEITEHVNMEIERFHNSISDIED